METFGLTLIVPTSFLSGLGYGLAYGFKVMLASFIIPIVLLAPKMLLVLTSSSGDPWTGFLLVAALIAAAVAAAASFASALLGSLIGAVVKRYR